MSITLSGESSAIVMAAVVSLLSLPVWLAAKITGAENPTFLRAAISLIVGTVAATVVGSFATGLSLILIPLAYLLSFKFVLGTSIGGSVLLAAVALGGYFAIASFVLSRFA